MNTLAPLVSTGEAAQRIFDWFKKDDAVFGMENEICIYRGDKCAKSSVRCAFGCLIPDDIYIEAMKINTTIERPNGIEGRLAQEVLETSIAMKMYFANVDTRFLNRAQDIHDEHSQKGNSMQHFLSDFVLMCYKEFEIEISF